jgi:hypothetical protein
MGIARAVLILVGAIPALAADAVFTPYEEAKPVLEAFEGAGSEAAWTEWSRTEDRAIRARLEQGELDSMVNLLLFGTSFTSRPRIEMDRLTEASRSGLLRARLGDLLEGIRSPGGNARLAHLRTVLRGAGNDPDDPRSGTFILQNLERVLREKADLAARANESSVFRGRGVSLDATIFPNFAIEEALRDLKRRGLLRDGEVARVAVIGPGLDFIDKDSGYDYYPEQTLQPFALYDSLRRLELAERPRIAVLDISPRVSSHIQSARERAQRREPYVLQLPHDPARRWAQRVSAYWQSFGSLAGAEVEPLAPPEALTGLQSRAVAIRPEVVLACEAADLNIVFQRIPGAQYDLIVATNLFVYYGAMEQALALQNVAAMLRPGGILLSNDRLPELPGSSLTLAGSTSVTYSEQPQVLDSVSWYRKR